LVVSWNVTANHQGAAMSHRFVLSGLMLLWGVGCSGSHANTRAGESAMSLGEPAGEPLLVRGSAITGPRSSLVISDSGMHGRYRDTPVSLEWTWQRLEGAVGANETKMELAEGDDTRLWGTFGGMPVDLTLAGEWLFGNVGSCGYALHREGEGFVGRRICGGPVDVVQLAFPAPLLERPLGEKAALMSLMLVNSTSNYTPGISVADFTRPRTPLVGNGQGRSN
jgi:hypothetical protein